MNSNELLPFDLFSFIRVEIQEWPFASEKYKI